MSSVSRSIEEAFWRWVTKQPEGCWIWSGGMSNGHPQVCYQAKATKASRFSFLLHGGVIPEGESVRILCGNKLCVNPEHLAARDFTPEELHKQAVARFWENVRKPEGEGCWIWVGALKASTTSIYRYGEVWNGQRCEPAHRFSYRLHNNIAHEDLSSTRFVCHKCDNPVCVHPGHLFLGDHAANMADLKAKGRAPRGARQHLAILTEGKVQLIRRLFAEGKTYKEVAELTGATVNAVNHVLNGRTWGHLPVDPTIASQIEARRASAPEKSELTEDKVRTIRALREKGDTMPVIAQAVGVSVGAVNHVIHGRSWKHVR